MTANAPQTGWAPGIPKKKIRGIEATLADKRVLVVGFEQTELGTRAAYVTRDGDARVGYADLGAFRDAKWPKEEDA